MEKYEPLGVVGEGSYGVVLKCRHRESGRSVAIKKFIDSEDDQNVRKIALREIRVLRKLRHENLVNLLEVFRRRKHLYLVFEFIDHTLLEEMEGKPGGLDKEVCRKYIYQLLRGLGFCHDNNIIHRDVKPENILVSKNGIVKLCDFGFARNVCGPGENLTDYVATRWYRAPELLVGDVAYGKEVDIWAVGCLFAEMMTGDPLYPGDSDIDQLFLIAQCLGRLSRRHLNIMSRNSAFRGFQFPKSRNGSTASNDSNSITHNHKLAKMDPGSRIGSKGSIGSGNKVIKSTSPDTSIFTKMFPSWSEEALYFLTLCLDPEPSGRPSCNSLLRLSYFTHDNFPSRFINELNQKLQLEGRYPIPSYSTRKKKSVLGSLKGANQIPTIPHYNSVGHLSKKNPIYQARLNLSEGNSTNNANTTTKYTDTFTNNETTNSKRSLILNKGNLNASNDKLPLTREQTFLVEKVTFNNTPKSMGFFNPKKPEGPSNETKIPSLLNRKYSDDSILNGSSSLPTQNGHTSKSTPNIGEGIGTSSSLINHNLPNVNKEKKFSIQNHTQSQSLQIQQQPRKYSFSFPPPESKEFVNDEFSSNVNSSKIFQPLPITTLTFNLNHHNQSQSQLPIPSSNTNQPFSKSPNNSYMNLTGLLQKRTPTPGPGQTKLKNGESNSTTSSYFPTPHFSINNNNNVTNQTGRFPVSFYQGSSSTSSQTQTPKSLPSTIFGSSMMLKNLVDTNPTECTFLPKMPGKGVGVPNGVKDEDGPLFISNQAFSKSNIITTSLPRSRRESIVGIGKWDQQQQSGVKMAPSQQLLIMPKGVSKHDPLSSSSMTGSTNNNTTTSGNSSRHFSTFSTQ